LLVRDERGDIPWDGKLFAGMMTAVGGLPAMGIRAITVTLPDAAPGDAHIRVSAGYDVIVSLLGDVDDQLSTLAVLIADHSRDKGFKPAYIDVRTPGRAYFR
jgi:hypothetical protein